MSLRRFALGTALAASALAYATLGDLAPARSQAVASPAPPASPPVATAPPTLRPTPAPTLSPTLRPTPASTLPPTAPPTLSPSPSPSQRPTVAPTAPPTSSPTLRPTPAPSPTSAPARLSATPLSAADTVPIPGHPFAAVFAADGTAVFVSVDVDFGGGIAVLTPTGAHLALSRFVALRGTPGGLTLTPDGTTLVVTTGSGLALLDARALAGTDDPNLRTIDDSASDGSIDVVVAPTGEAYFTNENTGTVGIADLKGLRVLGHVKVDSGPVGLALTPDGRSLFVTSEVAATSVSNRTCTAQRGAIVREGTLSLIDLAAALAASGRAVRTRAAAGCSPSRVVVTPAGDVAWVSARDDNAVLAFDAAHFATLPANLPFSVGVGNAPIGLALLDGGRVLAVANSDRYAADVTASTLSMIDTNAAFATGHGLLSAVPTGGFPRGLALSRDLARLVLTNYRSNTVQIFDVGK